LGALRDQGLDGPAVVGLLAAELDLVPRGSRISAAELLEDLKNRPVSPQHLKLQDSTAGGLKLEGPGRQGLSLELPLRRLVASQMGATLNPHQT